MRINLMIIAAMLLALESCAAYKPIEPLPGLLTPPAAGLSLNVKLTDYDALVYSNGVKQVLSGRVTNLERGDLALALSGSALAGGASLASASGASAAAISAIMAVGAALNSATAIINPAIRANALSEGNTLALQAESRYVLCISGAGITRISKSQLTPCGAQLIADVNEAIASTNRLLVGLMPSARPPAQPAPVNENVVKSINSEASAPSATAP